jgi:hypothetical protein
MSSTIFQKQNEPPKKRKKIGRPKVSYSSSSHKRDKVNQALKFILDIAGSPEKARQLTEKVLDKLASEPTNSQLNFQQLPNNIRFCLINSHLMMVEKSTLASFDHF